MTTVRQNCRSVVVLHQANVCVCVGEIGHLLTRIVKRLLEAAPSVSCQHAPPLPPSPSHTKSETGSNVQYTLHKVVLCQPRASQDPVS